MLSKTSFVMVLLLGVCFAQQSSSSSGTDKQVRLEDIERDTLSNSQQRTQTTQQQSQQQQSQQQQTQQQYGFTQQQLAAYQQQLLLQQLQQQYFAPQPISYPSFNAVPLMIIPGNQLGVGSPALPLQAYFLPDPFLYQQPGAAPATQQQAAAASVASPANSVYQVPTQRIQPTARYQPLVSNQLPVYRIPQAQQPVHNFIYTSNPAQAPHQQHLLFQQQAIQQPYNAYNAIYQQRPQKNLYSSGIKSTPAPPSLLKSSSQSNPIAYSQTIQAPDQTSSSYINYKSF